MISAHLRSLPFPTTPGEWELLIARYFPQLSERERQVCARRALNWSDSQIGADLFLSEQTIKTYSAKILVKLGLERTRAIPGLCHQRLWDDPASLLPPHRKVSTKGSGPAHRQAARPPRRSLHTLKVGDRIRRSARE